ncbi:hypothetical protein LAUMK4_05714 [Mycobacterium persicum]|uniref:Uncharacterized protein n=1 Tax=Mycobacterium persicum TaxID=1487726 RepID=A0ABY6RSI1_9MYCO|nr:hypothetical protein [Mycobacterium persicum]VBA32287.1 hypothetical protein LAUMK4_05714 [Mycobacterium persicum]
MGKRDAAGRERSSGELVAALLSQPRACGLDSAQQARLQRVACDAVLLYPKDPDLQRCAVDAAIDYLYNSADLQAAAAQWQRIREEEKRIRARVRQLAVLSVADRIVSERRVARAIGVDRMRLRRWSGKPTSMPGADSSLDHVALR